jgi:hypothetical protein
MANKRAALTVQTNGLLTVLLVESINGLPRRDVTGVPVINAWPILAMSLIRHCAEARLADTLIPGFVKNV